MEIIPVQNCVIGIRSQKYLFSSILHSPPYYDSEDYLFHFSEVSAGIYCISNATKKATVSSLTFPPLHTQEGTSTHDKHESIQTCIKGCSFGDRFPKRSRQALYDDQPNIHFHVLQLHRHFLCTMHHAAVWWNALSVQPEQLAVCCKDWGMFSLGRVFIPGYDRCVYVKPESLNANSPSKLGF